MNVVTMLKHMLTLTEERASIIHAEIEYEFLNRALPISALISLFHDSLSDNMSSEAKAVAVGIYMTNLLNQEVAEEDEAEV